MVSIHTVEQSELDADVDDLLVEETELADDDESQNIRYEITSYPTDFTVKVVYEKWQSGQIVLPDYQRRYVWNLPQASRFIESFLLGLPIPQVFLYQGALQSLDSSLSMGIKD